MITNSGVTIELYHVKGHQDKNQFRPFTCDAALNIEVDILPKTKLASCTLVLTFFHIPWRQGVCYIGTNRVEKDFGKQIWDHINGQATKRYWEKQLELTQGIWNKIDWESTGRAMQELLVNKLRWVAKYVSGHFATGKNMQRWKFRTSAQCPRCMTQVEDKEHILACPDPQVHEIMD